MIAEHFKRNGQLCHWIHSNVTKMDIYICSEFIIIYHHIYHHIFLNRCCETIKKRIKKQSQKYKFLSTNTVVFDWKYIYYSDYDNNKKIAFLIHCFSIASALNKWIIKHFYNLETVALGTWNYINILEGICQDF